MRFKDLFGSAADKDETAQVTEQSRDSGYDTPLGVGATAAEDIQRLMQARNPNTKVKAGM